MPLFRPATHDDIDAIARLTATADRGLTTVPKTRADVAACVEQTQRFLHHEPDACRILFVAETDGGICGISAIIPRLGIDRPFYSFRRSRHTRMAASPKLSVTYETLQLTTDLDGHTELATLFLSQAARGGGVARLLSLGRLAFIATHRDRFENKLMADIRGWFGAEGVSPFWAHLTSKFIDLPFDEADRLSMEQGLFIDQLLPSVPIFLNILPPCVAECVGKPNEGSAPAIKLLQGAGFELTEFCDVFDGGPSIACDTDKTLIARTLSAAASGTVETPQTALIFTGHDRDFRAVLGTADFNHKTVNAEVANMLAGPPLMIARTDAGAFR